MKLKKIIDGLLEKFLIVILSMLVIDVFWQVVSRYVLMNPSSFTDELARLLLIWVGILGAAYVTGKRLHLAIDVVIKKFSLKGQRIVFYFINISVLVFALLVMVIGGINLIYILLKLGNISPALSLPIGYIYSVIPLSGIVIIYYSLFEIFIGEKPGQQTNQKIES
ncbi:MAG: TRAP transporter small permease [Ignavibacteria bacterium]|jgi:TRAP-type C4-dicarboxylate transport system permease small subunit